MSLTVLPVLYCTGHSTHGVNKRYPVKVQEACALYHERLVLRFDTELPLPIKKFWFVACMLDPRFKKLSFDGDAMIKPAMRRHVTLSSG